MESLLDRLTSRDTMMDAEQEILELGENAVPLLKGIFDGSSRNEWGIAYRDLGLPLRCALEMVVRLGPTAKPLEPYVAAELLGMKQQLALGALGTITQSSIVCLANLLDGNVLIASEAAAALIRCGEDRSPFVEQVIAKSDAASNRLKSIRKYLER